MASSRSDFGHFSPFWPHFEKQEMAAMPLSVMKSAYVSLIIGPRGLVCEGNL